MVNLSALIRFHALRTPDKEALAYARQRITYSEFLDRILRMAAFLGARGIGAGDVVAVFMKNSAAFLEIAFATSHLGAVFLPINFRLARDECEYIVGNAGAKLVFADVEFEPIVAKCRRHYQRDVLPRNPSGKLLKRVLREEYAAGAAAEKSASGGDK